MKQLLNPSVIAWSIIFMSNPFSIRINELEYQSFIAPIESYTMNENRINHTFYGLTDHQSVYSLVYLQDDKIVKHFFEAEYIENEKSIFSI